MNSRRNAALLAIAIPAGAAAWWLWSTSRAATRSPRYTVVRRVGSVEIRDYPALTVVNAPMTNGAMNTGFRTLFRYITGANDRFEKIPMTTPVLVETSAESKTMGFIMPGDATPSTIPKSSDRTVSVTWITPTRFAVLRFPGERTAENEAKAAATLAGFLTPEQRAQAGDPIIAYYDPPWTPVFLRRNEVLIPLAADPV